MAVTKAKVKTPARIRQQPREAKTSKRKLEAIRKQKVAIEMRLAGSNYEAIAAELGYADPTGARKAILAAMDATIRPAAEELRALESARLDALQDALWGKRAEPATARVLVRVFERRAKLLGLDLQPDLPPFIFNIILALPGRAPRILRSLADVEGLTDEELEVLAQLQESEEGKAILLPQRAYDIT